MFSIVIPLYNKEHSIENTLKSVLSQSVQDFEIIVIDDGSTDSSPEVVKNIKDDRIKLIYQENQGVSVARNNGIKNAKYNWISFLDGDDLWEKNHLLEIKRMMNKYPKEKVFSTSFRLSNGREFRGDIKKSEIYKVRNFFKEYIEYKGLVLTIAVVIHKSCLEVVGAFNCSISLGEDIDLWARISKKYDFIKSNRITAIYRKDAENRSDRGKYNMNKSFLSIIDFKAMKTKEEVEFYKFWIIHKAKSFIVKKDYNNLWFLIKRYVFWFI